MLREFQPVVQIMWKPANVINNRRSQWYLLPTVVGRTTAVFRQSNFRPSWLARR